jgi:hypothetical protein
MSPRIPDRYFYTFRSSKGQVVKVMRGDDSASIVGGEGGWNTIARPRRTSLTQWGGRDPYSMDVPIIFDGWRYGVSVEREIRMFQEMARGYDFSPPPTIKIDGALPINGATWVITSIDWGNEVFWSQAAKSQSAQGSYYRLRQDAVVHLLQFQDEQRLKITLTNSLPNQYTVPKGTKTTLKDIAKAMYGNGSRWKEIQQANPKIRDPNKVSGTVRIP